VKDDPFKSGLDYAYRLLGYRARSAREIDSKLEAKGYDRSTIRKVIDRLKDLNYLNDLEFARSWVDERMKSKPRGQALLRHELMSKGIDKGIIDSVIAEFIQPEDEYRMAKGIADQRLKHKGEEDIDRLKKRIHDYLVRRGFAYDVVDQVLREIFEERRK